MSQLKNTFTRAFRPALIALLAIAFAPLGYASEDAGTEAASETSGRAVALELDAVVTAINLETRQVTLQGPTGEQVTVTSQENLVKLEDVSVGDRLLVTYLAALEGELREPTEEELAEPWVVLEDAGASEDPQMPGVAAARVIRAVVTIEGMNREFGTVSVKDSRGMLHMIGDVEAEKMEGVTLGQTLVLVYTEAMAVSLEIQSAAAE